MKNLHILVGIVFLSLASCSKIENKSVDENVQNENTEIKTQKLEIDTLKIADSVQITPTLTADYNKQVLVFKGLDKQVLDSLYKNELYFEDSPLNDYSKQAVDKKIGELMQQYFSETKENIMEYTPDFKQTWSQYSRMEFFSNHNDYLTINYTGEGFSGGAHGYAYDKYKVVDLKNQKKLMLEDIIDVSKVDWKQVLLKNIFDKDVLFDENISYNQNFYFDQNHITFVYNQYEIGPYAAGIIEITVPFSDIPGALKPEFKQRMNVE